MGNTTSKSKPGASQSSAESKCSEAKPAAHKPTQSTQKHLCRLMEVKDTAELTASFLKAPDLASLCRASKSTQLFFSKHLAEMALLKAVFDADPKRVKEILDQPKPPKSKCIVLTRTHIRETYISRKMIKKFLKKEKWTEVMVCKREWTNISSLEAAAWCGDIFLVRDLLLHVPETQKPEACKQLKGILEKKEFEANGAHLAPYKALIQAYENYDGQFNALIQQDNFDELNKLWNEVWQRQRSLPTYGLQEYCDDKVFFPLPSFTEPPKRSCCLYSDPKQLLELDITDFGFALFKRTGIAGGGADRCKVSFRPIFDLAAISRLCVVRIKDLANLISELEGPKLLEEADSIEKETVDKPGLSL